MTVGIVCEYNPLHLGHLRQIRRIRQEYGEDAPIVCAMSGNFVQRGAPALFDKSIRAEAAIACGADLVVELPVTAALSSAEGFAAGGVAVLSRLCDVLCFGTETGDRNTLLETAQALLSDRFPSLLRNSLDTGIPFPAARAEALRAMGISGALLCQPNDILAVEYCKAILSQNAQMEIFPIHRSGSYHAEEPDPKSPSATALRSRILSGQPWEAYVPDAAVPLFSGATLHTLESGERAILGRLRTMTEVEFEALPYGSEGLWRKLMHASRKENTLEDIFTAVKSKRYTRTRLQRMVLCAFLGITREDLTQPLSYARVLAFNDRGRSLLKDVRNTGFFPNSGAPLDHPCQALENRCGDLYGLFSLKGPEPPGTERIRRVIYRRD